MVHLIFDRRSIRKYQAAAVPKACIDEILYAGMAAPSSKNRQPWKFIVTTGDAKANALHAMYEGLQREKTAPLLPASSAYLVGAENTLRIMQQAPVVIFIVNPLGQSLHKQLTAEERIYEICNAQSIGAAIENMTLRATELGLGSLWICDTYFAYSELLSWLQTDGELAAALAIGHADEAPPARPRKSYENAVLWKQ